MESIQRESKPEEGKQMAANWRDIARKLASALATVPCPQVWRDWSEGDRHASYIIDFWEEDADAAGKEWHAAEIDALSDDLFNGTGEQPSGN